MAAVLFWFRMVEVPLAGEGRDGLATLATMGLPAFGLGGLRYTDR